MNLSTKTRRLEGYAAVYEQRTEIIPGLWEEEFATGSFDDVLKSDSLDVRALFNHDSSLLLGRSTSDTLKVGSDDHGLYFDILLPNTTTGNDVYELAERGDLSGASIQFVPGDYESLDSGSVDRHTRVEALYDVSPVTFPAYEGTETQARSRHNGSRRHNSQMRARALLIRHKVRMLNNG